MSEHTELALQDTLAYHVDGMACRLTLSRRIQKITHIAWSSAGMPCSLGAAHEAAAALPAGLADCAAAGG